VSGYAACSFLTIDVYRIDGQGAVPQDDGKLLANTLWTNGESCLP